MTFPDLINNVLIPGLVSLIVALITLHFTNSTRDKSDFKHFVEDSCKKIHFISLKKEPSLHEEDFNFEVSYLWERIKITTFIKENERDKIKKKIRSLKYQYQELTKTDVESSHKMTASTNILQAISSIRGSAGVVV